MAWVNIVVTVSKILPAVLLAAQGDKDCAQTASNQLLLTTGPVSLLYYGYGQFADLLNMELSVHAANLYATLSNVGSGPRDYYFCACRIHLLLNARRVVATSTYRAIGRRW